MFRWNTRVLLASLIVLLGSRLAMADGPVYELRVYTCHAGKLPALHERFANHTMQLFEKHGMKNIAYWTPMDEPDSQNVLIYVIQHASREAATASWEAFLADPEWQKVAADSKAAHGEILAKAPEATFMSVHDYSPEITLAGSNRIYELRIYKAAEGKLGELNDRFRQHTTKLFERHGIQNYAYWAPTDAPKSENELLYIVAHPSREQAAENWEAFGNDPEWREVARKTQENGKLLAERPISIYMQLTEYSPALPPLP